MPTSAHMRRYSEKPPQFTKHADGRVTVDRWTEQVTITKELLDQAEPHMIIRDKDTVTIIVANGQATYRITEEDDCAVDCDLVSKSMVEA